jgi:S-DNA-T family DNA segregation ATPase FtsK/SpoIIIE
MYFLVFAEIGEKPYSIVFSECKTSKNQDSSKQTRDYEIVFDENPLIFELFYRLYADITDALLGKQVYIPNFGAMYDREASLLAYIHRLDIDEEKAEKLKKAKITNITDFLKKKVQSTGAMKKYLKTINKKFISAETLNYKDMKIEDQIRMKLMQYGIAVEYRDKIVGHSVELYRFEPSVGLKMSKIEGFVKDIEQVVERTGVRILAPIPNSGLIGFEVPLKDRTFPALQPSQNGFNINIGVDVMGNNISMDVREMPHALVAGSSGSGKSVFLHSVIRQLLKTDAELCLFDPKKVEFEQYKGKVHKYLSNHNEIAASLDSLVEEMEARYDILKKAKVRSIADMPSMKFKIVIIDEYAMLTMKAQTEHNIQLLAQTGRACGIHLIIATQRASAKIISGDTKVNFPTKIVFRMAKSIDSRIMLDEEGAEKLLGKGDMLFYTDNDSVRLQGYNI